jgi:D-alanyl-D-alanine carboxypeptidase
MPRLLIAPALCLAAVTSLPAQDAGLTAGIDSVVGSRVARDLFSGVVVVADGGRVIYQRAAGLADRERGIPITLDTRLELGSVTKLFTRIAVLQLVQAGKLSLLDTVGRFLPDYPNAEVRSRVTVEQLLAHRSGIGSFWNDLYMARLPEIRTVGDYLALFQRDSLLFEPGTSTAYSNGGYVVLGAIIERVSGKLYHDYLSEHVFDPAGMTRTIPYDRRVPLAEVAIGYTRQPLSGPMPGDRRLAGQPRGRPGGAPAQGPRNPNTSVQPGRSGPAGGHLSTAGDFLKLASAIGSHRLLDSAHTRMLYGSRWADGRDFRANGGGPGVNAEFSIFPAGQVMVVFSNYDPPAATEVAEYIRSRLAPTGP